MTGKQHGCIVFAYALLGKINHSKLGNEKTSEESFLQLYCRILFDYQLVATPLR